MGSQFEPTPGAPLREPRRLSGCGVAILVALALLIIGAGVCAAIVSNIQW